MIIHLPDDCLSIIFQKLDSSTDRESFGLTCHPWLKIQNTNRKSLQFSSSFTIVQLYSSSRATLLESSYHVHRLLTRFQHLEHVSLTGCTDLLDSGLNLLQLHDSRLLSLILDCCFGITDLGLSLIATSCPSLTDISFYRCNITDDGLQALANGCLGLKRINLSYCANISDHGLRALCKNCCEILAVKISWCKGVSGKGFKGCSSTLCYIDAENCNLEPEGISCIVSGGGIEYLNLHGLNIHGGALAEIGSGFASKLKIPNLRLCRTLGDESIMAIARGCPLLKELNLALCNEVRLAGWEAIGANCNELETLHANRCRNLCDLGLQGLRQGCKKLKVLYISRGSRLTSTALEVFTMVRDGVKVKHKEVICIGPDWTLR
ncbi:unnamed protein product [Linum trigynum]|uniref:F-box/LRR-repeat protein 12 n=1 Tax=Linum trigynum TaxID=586398 RepID=A0AAV2GBU2_9ROSI